MSTIIVISVMVPAAAAVWPVVATAAVAAASAMGFAAVQEGVEVEAEAAVGTEVEVSVKNSEAVTGQVALGEELVFQRGDVEVKFCRGADGKVAVKVHGHTTSPAELAKIGQELGQRLVQQYTYHRLVTELKNKDFSLVDQEVEEDGTVRLHVRTYQG